MLKHKKKRNSFIVFEQLVGLVTRLAASGNNKEASLIMEFLKNHFKPGSQLFKEYRLINEIISSNGYSKEEAYKVIEEALLESQKISSEALEKEKTKLIQDINSKISSDLYNIPVKEYKTAASIQILMNESRSNNNVTTPGERIIIKSNLAERLSRKETSAEKDKVDNITFAVLVSKFNQRYSKLMNEDQKNLLSAWTNYLIDNNEDKFKNILQEKVSKLKTSLSTHMTMKKHKGAEHESLLKEAYSSIAQKDYSMNEQSVYEIMRYFDLVEDLENYNEQITS